MFASVSGANNFGPRRRDEEHAGAPEAIDFIYEDAARFPHFRRTAQTMGEFLSRCDWMRRKAESRVVIGGPPPETFVSILRLLNSSLGRSGKSLASASAQGNLGMAAATRLMQLGKTLWRPRICRGSQRTLQMTTIPKYGLPTVKLRKI